MPQFWRLNVSFAVTQEAYTVKLSLFFLYKIKDQYVLQGLLKLKLLLKINGDKFGFGGSYESGNDRTALF